MKFWLLFALILGLSAVSAFADGSAKAEDVLVTYAEPARQVLIYGMNQSLSQMPEPLTETDTMMVSFPSESDPPSGFLANLPFKYIVFEPYSFGVAAGGISDNFADINFDGIFTADSVALTLDWAFRSLLHKDRYNSTATPKVKMIRAIVVRKDGTWKIASVRPGHLNDSEPYNRIWD